MRIRKVNQLVITGYALLTVLMLTMIAAGDHYTQVKDDTSRHREISLHLADQLLAGSKSLTASVRAFAATGDLRYRDAFIEEQTVTRTRDKAVAELRQVGITNDELDLIERAKASSDQLISLEKRAFAAGEVGDLKLAVDLVYGHAYQTALASIYGPIEDFRSELRARLARESDAAQRRVDLSRWVARGLILTNVLLVVALLVLFYRRRVIQPLLDLDEQVRLQLSGGGGDIIGHQDDTTEIGDLARSLADFCRLENRVARQRQNKRQATELSLALQQTHDHDQLTHTLFTRLADLLEVRCGLLHLIDESDGSLTCVGGYGLAAGDLDRRTAPGEGLAGQCAVDRKPLRFDQPPADYLRIHSATGAAGPSALLIRPLLLNEHLFGVLELAAFKPFDEADLELLEDLERVVVINLANLDYLRRQSLDTSRARASEGNMRAILDGMVEGIFSLDRDGKVLYINPAACRMLGYPPEALLGQCAHERVHHSHADGRPHPHESCPMYLTLMDGQTRSVERDVMWRRDGSPVNIRYRTTPLLEADGQCIGSVIDFSPLDESDRRQTP
jgi:PAS domain S-box-containing protein